MAQTPIKLAVQRSVGFVNYNAAQLSWGDLFLGSVPALQIQVVQPTGNLTTSPFSVINETGYSMIITVSDKPKGDGTQTIYSGPTSLTWNNGLLAFTGSLDLTIAALKSAMGTNDSLAVTIELELYDGTLHDPVYQKQGIIILAPANAGSVTTPTPAVNYRTALQSDARYVRQDGGNAGDGYFLICPDGLHKVYISANNDGSEKRELVTI